MKSMCEDVEESVPVLGSEFNLFSRVSRLNEVAAIQC